jgi:hypothetical protein
VGRALVGDGQRALRPVIGPLAALVIAPDAGMPGMPGTAVRDDGVAAPPAAYSGDHSDDDVLAVVPRRVTD